MNDDAKVKVFKELSAFAEYLRDESLVPRVLSSAGRMSIVGAFNARGELIAKVAGYRPKEA